MLNFNFATSSRSTESSVHIPCLKTSLVSCHLKHGCGWQGDATHAEAGGPVSTNEKIQQQQYRIRQLEEQLASAQEAVAGATSTSKTFQSVAESNEAAMSQLQVRALPDWNLLQTDPRATCLSCSFCCFGNACWRD